MGRPPKILTEKAKEDLLEHEVEMQPTFKGKAFCFEKQDRDILSVKLGNKADAVIAELEEVANTYGMVCKDEGFSGKPEQQRIALEWWQKAFNELGSLCSTPFDSGTSATMEAFLLAAGSSIQQQARVAESVSSLLGHQLSLTSEDDMSANDWLGLQVRQVFERHEFEVKNWNSPDCQSPVNLAVLKIREWAGRKVNDVRHNLNRC